MQETVWVNVEQTIYDGYTNKKEIFSYQGQAQLIKLASYWRLTYTDQDGAKIVLKWVPLAESDTPSYLEIRQTNYDLVFNKDKPTQALYPTPQGNWPLEVTTQQLKFETADEDNYQIAVDYQIELNEERLGNYEYRLQFGPEIVNMEM